MSFYAFYPPTSSGSMTNPSIGLNGSPAPTSSTEVAGINPSGNLQPLQTDVAGNLYVSLASEPVSPFNTKDAADGTPGTLAPTTAIQVAGTDGTNLRVLSTNATGQLNINNISGIVSLPTGAATSAFQSNVQSSPGTSATTAITIQGSVSGVAVPVSGTVTITPSGTQNVNLTEVSGLALALGQTTMSASLPVAIASDQTSIPVDATQSGTWTVQPGNTPNTSPWLITINQGGNSAFVTAGNALKVDGSAVTQPVSGTVSTTPVASSTSTVTSVSGSASSVQLLASNASRKNAAFFNDSTATLYLKLGTTASTVSYTVQIPGLGYYELPVGPIYTGEIDGIWSSAVGAVLVTELS